MSSVPSIETDTGIFLQKISGFRPQEAWGRWMLGKSSSIKFFNPYDNKLGLYIKFVLPRAEQTLEVNLNGVKVAKFDGQAKPFSYSGQSILQLRKGINEIIFNTNKSNNMNAEAPFAPLDKTDISVSFSKISIEQILSYKNQTLYPVFNSYKSTEAQDTYSPVMNSMAELFFYGGGHQTLSVDLLKGFSNQNFIVSLDNEEIGRIESKQDQSLLRRQFVVTLPESKHVLSITSVTAKNQHGVVEETSGKVAEISGRGVFYIQSVNLSSNFYSNPSFQLISAISLVLVLLYICILFFFKNFIIQVYVNKKGRVSFILGRGHENTQPY